MNEQTYSRVLSIAGFDGSGGAGIQADLKTFSALGCYGMTVLTSLPVQNTTGVKSIYDISNVCIEEQLKAILDDIGVDAIKIGMLHQQSVIETVANVLQQYQPLKIVLDPVMIAKSGDPLLQPDAIKIMQERLFPLTTVLTPNLLEASTLLGRKIQTSDQMEQAAIELVKRGIQAVVVKGGHLNDHCDDCLCVKNHDLEVFWFPSIKIQTPNTHGTGCTFSSAIAAFLARGFTIYDSVHHAKQYLTKAIEAGARFKIGKGYGPVHHFHELWSHLNTTLNK